MPWVHFLVEGKLSVWCSDDYWDLDLQLNINHYLAFGIVSQAKIVCSANFRKFFYFFFLLQKFSAQKPFFSAAHSFDDGGVRYYTESAIKAFPSTQGSNFYCYIIGCTSTLNCSFRKLFNHDCFFGWKIKSSFYSWNSVLNSFSNFIHISFISFKFHSSTYCCLLVWAI